MAQTATERGESDGTTISRTIPASPAEAASQDPITARDGHFPEEEAAQLEPGRRDGGGGGGGGSGSSTKFSGFRLVLTILSVTVASFLMLLDNTIVSTAIPKITDEFNSLDDIGWYGSAYSLAVSSLAPLSGKMYRHFSLKWTFLIMFGVFEVGSAICGAAQSSTMLIIGRAIAGIGAACILSGGMTIISCSAPPEKLPIITSVLMGAAQIGNVAGPLIGGAFTTGYTWRWCFYINLPLGAIVAFALALLPVPEQVPKQPFRTVLPHIHKHMDLLGFAIFAAAVIQLLLALQFGGNQFAWSSSQIIGLFCGAGATALAWAAWNYRQQDDALLPFSLLRRRVIWASTANYACLVSTLFGASYYLPIYFQTVKGKNALMSGVYLLPTIISQIILTISSGQLVSKVGYIMPFSVWAAFMTAIGSGLCSTFQPDTSLGKLIGFQVIAGLGRGAGLQMPYVTVQNSVAPHEISTAMSFIVWAQIMPTILLSVCNTMLTAGLRSELPIHAPNANATAIIAAGATHFKSVVEPADLPGVLVAWSVAIDQILYLVAAVAVVAFFAAMGMGWKDIRKKGQDVKKEG